MGLARIIGYGMVAGPDASLHAQPAHAIAEACRRAGLSLGDLDVLEINEAWNVLKDPERRRRYDAELGEIRPDRPADAAQLFQNLLKIHAVYANIGAIDTNGNFTITELPAGDYEVEVWHEVLGKSFLSRAGSSRMNF